jgi:UDP-glucose 4-epimerase
LSRVEEITGKSLNFYQVDLLDRSGVEAVFSQNRLDAVIHFAALKAPGESIFQPLRYYHNNLTGTIHLCQAMQNHGVKNMVFSSSATVYGEKNVPPLREDMPVWMV